MVAVLKESAQLHCIVQNPKTEVVLLLLLSVTFVVSPGNFEAGFPDVSQDFLVLEYFFHFVWYKNPELILRVIRLLLNTRMT